MSQISNTFDTKEPLLEDLLKLIRDGKLQLPDFQRGWVWDDDHIKDLLASISLSYPIGAVMFLQTGGDGVHFKPRLIEGVVSSINVAPDSLILDGQQRLTSLYLVLMSGSAVKTTTSKKEEIERIYYLNINSCLDINEDRLDAILSISPSKKITSDFGRKIDLDITTRELEYVNGYYPISLIFDDNSASEWRWGYEKHFDYDKDRLETFRNFEKEILGNFKRYKLPVIDLLKGTEKEAVCKVFEKVNTGGVVLTVFELLTASFAAIPMPGGDSFSLRGDWEGDVIKETNQEIPGRYEILSRHPQLRGISSSDFLTAITLLISYNRYRNIGTAVSCKRKDILKLELREYLGNVEKLMNGYEKTVRFLAREHIYDERNLPYQTQLIPLSAICAYIGDKFEQEPVRKKLAQWYWSGVFGEMYGGANETRYALDIVDVINWIDGGDEPRTIRDANFSPLRLLSLQTRNSAAYKGVMAQLIGFGSRDFINGDPIQITNYFDLNVDIHHIFPRAYCEQQKFPKDKWNSIVNKTPLTSNTNRILGGKAPSVYLDSIERNHGLMKDMLDKILDSHLIVPSLFWVDKFDDFIADRAIKLLDCIETAMGKQVYGRDSEDVIVAFGKPLVKENPNLPMS